MGNGEHVHKVCQIEAFVRDKSKSGKIAATIDRELRSRLFRRKEMGITAWDISSDLVEEALNCPDIWDAIEYPEFADWLLKRFRNCRHNIVRKENRHYKCEDEVRENLFDPSNNPDHVHDFENSELVKQIRKALNDKDELEALAVFDCVLNEKTNQEMSRELCLDISRVANAKKRIKRVVDCLLADFDSSV